MKIFISYGHNDHTALVDALYDALLRDGHEPWKDDRYEGTSGIPAGEDFTNIIYDAIRESDFVVAFVTAATQRSRYCCDERQYAYNMKGSHFIQLRLDGVEIRLGNAGSYIDMDAVERAGGIDQELFRQKLGALYAAFREPASLLSPSAKFERYLKIRGAMQYDEFIAMPERDDFVGREWLREQCKRWAMDDTIPCRLFVILGEAGTGKTAFVRHLAEDKELVRSVHVCVFDRPKTRNVKDTLKNLAYTLTLTNRSYSDFLRNRNFDSLEEMDYDGLFEFLFVEPLKNEKEKYLLIIDGLDELEETTGLNPLIKVLRQYARTINPNISILVTGRPEESIVSKIRTVHSSAAGQSVLLSKDNGREDLNAFIEKNLRELDCYSDALRQKIFEACDGNFEYLTLLFREAAEEGLRLSGETPLPRGLRDRYTQYLDRRMEKNGQEEELTREQHRLLSVLSVAYEPIPCSLLAAVTGFDDYDVNQELKVFGSLVRRIPMGEDDRLISFFSKGFRDYLLSGEYGQYSVSARQGHKAMAAYLMKRFTNEAAFARSPYMDKHGFTHLLVHMRKDREAAQEYLEQMKKADLAKTITRLAAALCSGEREALEAYFDQETPGQDERLVITRLKNIRATHVLNAIIEHYQEQGAIAKACTLQADVLRMEPTPENIRQAAELYHQAREIYQRELEAAPSYDTRFALGLVYERLGNMARALDTTAGWAEAEEWYGKLLALDEENFRENPGYECCRALGITYGRLGDVARVKGTPEGYAEAEVWYRKKLERDEENDRNYPGYESRRALGICYDRLAALAKAKETPEGRAEAEQLYLARLKLDEQNYRETPCYDSRTALSITCDHLGSLAGEKETPEGRAQQEEWCRRCLELDEENHRENPCYDTRHSLSITYDRLGRLARDKGGDAGYEEAGRWYRKSLEMDEQNYRENPCGKSRRNLSVTCCTLGDLAQDRHTAEAQAEAEGWYRRCLELDEQNYRENPIARSRRDLAVVYERLGAIADTRGKLEEAVEWYHKSIALHEENLKENPTRAGRRSLGISYEVLGITLQKMAADAPPRLEEAADLYRRAMELCEENLRENPTLTLWQDLANLCDHLGDIAMTRETPEGLAEAEEWYRKRLEICQRCYRENPTARTRRNLSLSYFSLAELKQEQGTPEALQAANEWYLRELELDEESLRLAPGYESRRDLGVTMSRLAALAQVSDAPDGKETARQWYLKKLELDEENHRNEPCKQTAADMRFTCAQLYRLAKAQETPEGEEEAAKWAVKFHSLE